MLRYIFMIAFIGLLFAIGFAYVDNVISKIEDKKKRKYTKIASYTVLYIIMGIIVEVVYTAFR